MPDPLAIPVLNILKILTPSDITSLSKEVSGTEKVRLTEILAEETGLNHKNSMAQGPEKKNEQEANPEKSQEDGHNKVMAPDGSVRTKKDRKKTPSVPKRSLLGGREKTAKNRENRSVGNLSSMNFFIQEKEKMKNVEVGIKKVEILKLYRTSSQVDIQKGKSEEDLAKTGQSGILFNKRRF